MPITLKTKTPNAKTPAIFLNKSVFKAGIKVAKPYQRKNNHTHQLARLSGKFIFYLLSETQPPNWEVVLFWIVIYLPKREAKA